LAGETLGFGSGLYDSFFIKTDALGNLLWTKTYGGSANYEYTSSFIQTEDHGYLLAGATASFGAGGYDGYLVKTDSSGNVMWSKTYGNENSNILNSVMQTMDGGYILSERSYPQVSGEWSGTILKISSVGDTLWTRTFGGADYDFLGYADQTADAGYVAMGYTMSFGAGSFDTYLVKTDSSGNSGCNQLLFPQTVTSPITIVTIPAPVVSSISLTAAVPATNVASRGQATTQCYADKIDESIDRKFVLFPNPVLHAHSFVIQRPEGAATITVEVFNILGEKIPVAEKSGALLQIDLPGISPGIYFVRMTARENSSTQKLIVQ